ncbi:MULTISPECIES: O-antigen ligase family protein [Marinobacter]|uniref:O-antigen ligase family protein n=1 Tax=Marinobacter TaxID=2742 RepID=UPI000DABA106|nr:MULTISPECIES: O-antigen ligase family protein [Marinobacter]
MSMTTVASSYNAQRMSPRRRLLIQRARDGMVLFFVFMTILESVKIDIGRLANLKPFIIVILALAFHYGIMVKRFRWRPEFNVFVAWWLSLFIPALGGTIISMHHFIVIALGQLLLLGYLTLTYTYLYDRENGVIKVLNAHILVGMFCAGLSFLQIVGYFGGINLGVSHAHTVGFPRAESIFTETDWHAMYMGYVGLLLTVCGKHLIREKLHYQLALGATLMSLILSFGRTATFAYIGCLGIFLLVRRRFGIIAVGGALVFMLMLCIQLKAPFIPDSLVQRFNVVSTIEDSSTDSGALDSRLFALEMTWYFVQQEPFWGNGAGSIQELVDRIDLREQYASGGIMNAGRGGTNLFLTSLFDSGILGLLVVIAVLTVLFRTALRSYRITRRARMAPQRDIALFLVLGLVYFIVNCMSNNFIRYPLVWLHFVMIFLYHRQLLETFRGGAHANPALR